MDPQNPWQDGYGRFLTGRLAHCNGDIDTSELELDADRMSPFLKLYICRYAVLDGDETLVRIAFHRVPAEERFGIAKLAIDMGHEEVSESIIAYTRYYTAEQKLSLLEYAALQGSV